MIKRSACTHKQCLFKYLVLCHFSECTSITMKVKKCKRTGRHKQVQRSTEKEALYVHLNWNKRPGGRGEALESWKAKVFLLLFYTVEIVTFQKYFHCFDACFLLRLYYHFELTVYWTEDKVNRKGKQKHTQSLYQKSDWMTNRCFNACLNMY